MKTVVMVSAPEVIRMVAIAVMSRPENAGKVCPAVEVEGDAAGFTALNVVMFDTMEQALAYSPGFAGSVVAKPSGTVLQLVHPPADTAPAAQPGASDPP